MRTSVHENGELSLILFGFFGRSTALITAWLQIRVCRYVSCWHLADVLQMVCDVGFRGWKADVAMPASIPTDL